MQPIDFQNTYAMGWTTAQCIRSNIYYVNVKRQGITQHIITGHKLVIAKKRRKRRPSLKYTTKRSSFDIIILCCEYENRHSVKNFI